MYNQKIDHLKEGDLVAILEGWSHKIVYGIYVRSKVESNKVISISYFNLKYALGYTSSIRTRNSNTQRVIKITEDNLEQDILIKYLKWRRENIKKTRATPKEKVQKRVKEIKNILDTL